jgi:TDG/mug DNA glycosylase family protein
VRTNGFPAIAGADARVLILGTLPGQASLQKGEYYGQPRNAFWRIMGELFGVPPGMPYDERKRRIVASRVALWDVCAAADRPGSLDSAIDAGSVRANDLAGFLDAHRAVSLVCFNGSKAEALYRRLVLPGTGVRTVRYETLPSTSPAHAAMPYGEKLRRWSIVRSECEGKGGRLEYAGPNTGATLDD